MATKLELECKLLGVTHNITHYSNNESAFAFKRTLPGTSRSSLDAFEGMERYYAHRKSVAMKEADRLRAEIAALH